jgi:DNA-binding response OmpR family regulator
VTRPWRACEKTVTAAKKRRARSTLADVDEPATPGVTGRVLLVEDDPNIRDLVSLHLRLEGLDVVAVPDGREGLAAARARLFDLLILDVMLPGLDGVTLCGAVRRDSMNSSAPILMLTARREESDKVTGLESGADDYLTKPFGVRELVARVRALLRRVQRVETAGGHKAPITVGSLTVDPSRRQARIDGRDVELTIHEFELLYLLASNRGIVFSRDALMRRVWGGETHITERSVDTLVKRVRRKVEADPASPQFILTVWGTGYKFADV